MDPINRRRNLRLAFVFSLALVPLVLVAQSGPPRPRPVPAGATSIVMPFSGPGWQDKVLAQEGYVQPPRELADAVLAPRYLNVTLGNPSPDKKWFLNQIGDGPVADEDVLEAVPRTGRRVHRLQGEPRAGADDQQQRRHPAHLRDRRHQAHDSAAARRARLERHLVARRANVAFFVHNEDSTHIWIADVATGRSHQLTTAPVLATLVSSFDFTDDGKQIAVVLVPDQRGADAAGTPGGADRPEVKIAGGEQGQPAHVPEPDAQRRTTTRCSSGTRPVRWRWSMSRRAR